MKTIKMILRFVAAALVILITPAWWFWPPREWTHPTATNLSSYSLLLAGLLLSYALSRNLTRFPGERSKLSVIPVSAIGLGLPLVFAAMLRLPYSVYYLAAGFALTVLYLFAETWLEKRHIRHLYYIDVEGMRDLPQLSNIRWHELVEPRLPETARVNTVVTNLHAPDLGADWQRFLADCTLRGIAVYNIRQVEESLTGRVKIRHMYENDLGSLLPSPAYMAIKQSLESWMVVASLRLTLPLLKARGRCCLCKTAWAAAGASLKFINSAAWCAIRKNTARNWRRKATRALPALAASSAKPGWTSCRSFGTSSKATWHSSARAPNRKPLCSSLSKASRSTATATSCAPAFPAGRR